jgi:hypothetical protein
MPDRIKDRLTGYRVYADGSGRPIDEQADGRQYGCDDDGTAVYGVWLIPETEADLPVIVKYLGEA